MLLLAIGSLSALASPALAGEKIYRGQTTDGTNAKVTVKVGIPGGGGCGGSWAACRDVLTVQRVFAESTPVRCVDANGTPTRTEELPFLLSSPGGWSPNRRGKFRAAFVFPSPPEPHAKVVVEGRFLGKRWKRVEGTLTEIDTYSSGEVCSTVDVPFKAKR